MPVVEVKPLAPGLTVPVAPAFCMAIVVTTPVPLKDAIGGGTAAPLRETAPRSFTLATWIVPAGEIATLPESSPRSTAATPIKLMVKILLLTGSTAKLLAGKPNPASRVAMAVAMLSSVPVPPVPPSVVPV